MTISFPGRSRPPRYQVSLDDPPETRWNGVVTDYLDHLPAALEMVDDLIGTGWLSEFVLSGFGALTRLGLVHFGGEIKGIAQAAGVPIGKVALLQVAYEAFAACTSIVVEGQAHPLHIRTMDWDMPALQALTIEVDFVSQGKTLFSATTWAGYVGVLTGVRAGAFSVSINYRRTEQVGRDGQALRATARNFLRGLFGRHWPVSFLVREVLQQDETFALALASLTASDLMAPTYITVAGVAPGEGAIITREREGGTHRNLVLELHSSSEPFIVQANMDVERDEAFSAVDAWQDICESRHRRQLARTALGAVERMTETDLWLLTSVPPILADDTVYTVLMVPATGSLKTRVHATPGQENAGKERFRAEWKKANAWVAQQRKITGHKRNASTRQ